MLYSNDRGRGAGEFKLSAVLISSLYDHRESAQPYVTVVDRTVYIYTRVVPKVMSNFFLHANWEQQTKESAVVDRTSCCVTLECLVTPTAYIM